MSVSHTSSTPMIQRAEHFSPTLSPRSLGISSRTDVKILGRSTRRLAGSQLRCDGRGHMGQLFTVGLPKLADE